MSKKISSTIEQSVNAGDTSIMVSEGAEHPDLTIVSQGCAMEDDKFNELKKRLAAVLATIEPIDCPIRPEYWPVKSIIRVPPPHEVFAVADAPLIISCFVTGLDCDCGEEAGARCYPLNNALITEFNLPTRAVALHPCVTSEGFQLIFPRVIERRDEDRDREDASLLEALTSPPGTWMKLKYDAETDEYLQTVVHQDPDDCPEYTGYIWDVLAILCKGFKSDSDHSIQIHIGEQQRRYS